MEVHHHPDLHHKQKKWKEYFLEFLMIFLAVTMGFFAESIREHITDNAKEREFIQSMIEDAETDTANINQAIAVNELRVSRLDTLARICLNYDAANGKDSEIYRLFRHALAHPAFISPTERTIQQLKNAGGMRLIRHKAAVDDIVLYDDKAKKLADQQGYYELYQNESVKRAVGLLNFTKYSFNSTGSKSTTVGHTDSSLRLLTHERSVLDEFGNSIAIYGGIVGYYNKRLQEMKDHAINLIKTLREEYKLPND